MPPDAASPPGARRAAVVAHHVQVRLSAPGCRAVIDGTSSTASDDVVPFTYTNSAGVLNTRRTGRNRHFYNVRGCYG